MLQVVDRRLVTARHVKQLAQVGLLLLSGMCADGFFYSAHAQCAPTDKIYIDPRLVPRRPQLSEKEWLALTLPGSNDNPEDRALTNQLLLNRGQPIVIPYGTGKVLVHPTNPCIQQYIP